MNARDRLCGHPLFGVSVILGAALVVGLALRLGGANFCLPMEQCHPDEHWLLDPALKMLRTGDYNPRFFLYPTLFIYVLLVAFILTFLAGVSAGAWGDIRGLKVERLLLGGRIATGLLGSGTLLAVYAAGARLGERSGAAVAALVLALMPLHVADSHFIVTDVTAGFFCALALWAATRVADEGTGRHYRLLGLLSGFAAAAKYNAALVGFNLFIAHYANPRREGYFNANLVRGLAFCILGFFLAGPYSLFELPHFLDGLASEVAHYKRGHIGHQGEFNRAFYFIFLSSHGFGPVGAALGLYGAFRMLRPFRRQNLILLVFPVLYIVFLGSYKVRFVRNLMPVLPYLSLWIGMGAVSAFRDLRETWPALGRLSPWKLALPGLLLLLLVPGRITLSESLALSRPDTRLRAREWLLANVPKGSVVYLQSWSVDALPPGHYRITRDRWSWDYYVGTDRLSRKYFDMKDWAREKYEEVVEAFQHRPLAVFEGRAENPFYYTANPTVVIFERDPARPRIRPPR